MAAASPHVRATLPPFAFECRPGAAARRPAPAQYRRREPEKTPLHQVVRENLESLLADARQRNDSGSGYPAFVEKEFRHFVNCGLLAGGFARLRCPACHHEQLVAFSCKGRICPSCWARRASDIAAHLVDKVLPVAPYRQWVLTFPWELRLLLAFDTAFLSEMTGAFLKILFAWQRLRGRRLGLRDGETGSVTFVQRFGGVANLNPHLHVLVPDGLFLPATGDTLTFEPLPPPDDQELRHLVVRIATRLGNLATRRIEEAGKKAEWQWPRPDKALLHTDGAEALRSPRDPRRKPGPTLGLTETDREEDHKPLCDSADGFSLHAARTVAPRDRDSLEALCRYGLRAPFSNDRLTLEPDGRVRLRLLRPWANGRTDVVMEPLALMRRLAVLVPAPYQNLVRYHGVFANRSKCRPRLPKPPPNLDAPLPAPAPLSPKPTTTTDKRRERVPWAALLRRVLDVDALACPRCSTPMIILAFLTDPPVVRKILLHLGLPAEPPVLAPARCCYDEPAYLSDFAPDPPFFDDEAPPPVTGWTARAPP